MPSFGILRTAMFRFERERVLHCYLYRGTENEQPSCTATCIAGRRMNSHPALLLVSRDGGGM
ncbi:MAG: hypothetical protein KH381_09495 [Clostridium sp.]|nr:hypothetical protein [Clostridium sp.]